MSPTLIVPLTIAAEGSLLHKFGDTHAPRAVFPTTTRTNPTIQQVETHEDSIEKVNVPSAQAERLSVLVIGTAVKNVEGHPSVLVYLLQICIRSYHAPVGYT